MQVDLTGNVALVTGAGHGIGRAIAETLARNGAAVAVLDVDEAAAREVAETLAGEGAATLPLRASVADEAEVQAAVGALAARFGRLDILVNNAGIGTYHRVPLHEYPPDDWQRILDIDLTGVYLVSRAAIPRMLEGSGARIVNVSSVAGLVPLRLQSAYVAAKAGVANLTRSMAAELGESGIRVNAVAPGSTLTRATRAVFYGEDGSYREQAQDLISHIPLGRPGSPEEIAAAVLFLVAPAASYVTGVVLPVDGGWLASYHRDW